MKSHDKLKTQLTYACLKSPMETLEQCLNLFENNNKDTRMTLMTSMSINRRQ